MAKIAVVLSGSGVYDGSELHEAVLTLLHLDRHGAEIRCFAPDKPQMHVINHLAGETAEGESRNVLVEAARIARGDIKPLNMLAADRFDAVIFPGGYGAAKNLCTFAVDGAHCTVDDDVRRVVLEFHRAGKPVAPMCIAPAIVARVLGGQGVRVRLTIGNDRDTAAALETMGAEHVECPVDDVVVDEANRVVSTPAYMLGPSIAHVDKGIGKLVDTVLGMVGGAAGVR